MRVQIVTLKSGASATGTQGSSTNAHRLSAKQIADFQRDGYLHLPGFFAPEEIAPVARSLEEDPTAGGNVFTYEDGPTSNHQYVSWLEPKDDLIGVYTTIERIVNGAEALLDSPVYHYHSKIVIKPPHNQSIVGWHHDYSGWYADGCIAPDMLTCLVAVTPATKNNGCLNVLKGSNRVGRMEIGGRRKGADEPADPSKPQLYFDLDPRRFEAMLRRFELVEVEMARGDALYFHSSTVHSSAENTTDKPRIFLEMSYNATSNEPVIDGQEHHRYRPMHKTTDSAIKERRYTNVFGRTPCLNVTDPQGSGYKIFLGNRPKG